MSLLDTLRGEKREAPASSEPLSNPKLQDLIPLAMVIVGGCEPCAENMVKRALQQSSSWHDIDKTLHIIASIQKLDCFAKAVGPEVIARMEKPLAASRGTLQQAIHTPGCSPQFLAKNFPALARLR